MTNMQKYAPSQGHTLLMVPRCLAAASGRGFDSDGCDASPAEAGTLCGRGYGSWFSPSTGRRSGRYVHDKLRTTGYYYVTNPGYPGLSQFIW